jgi:hypothetical protein
MLLLITALIVARVIILNSASLICLFARTV